MIKLTPLEKHIILVLREMGNGEVVIKKQNFKIVDASVSNKVDKRLIADSERIIQEREKKLDSARV